MSEFKEHEESLNFQKNLKGKFCERPFQLLEIQKEFYGFVCCPSWLPTIVGNCKEDGVLTVWNSEVTQKVRKSILDGTFKYCDHLECPRIQDGSLLDASELSHRWKSIYENQSVIIDGAPEEIALCYDESCNLSCPSCRSGSIMDVRGKTYNEKLAFTKEVVKLINATKATGQQLYLRVTGSGDPIASPVFFKLLKSIDGKNLPNLKITLQTNGTLLTPTVWSRLSNIHNNIGSFSISIDAATEATYTKVRKHGNWERLLTNLSFISDLVNRYNISSFILNFVVQKENYFEMSEFVRFSQSIGNVTKVFFSFVNDWGSWSNEGYLDQCIWKKSHAEFETFIENLKDPIFDADIVQLGNLYEYRKFALMQN